MEDSHLINSIIKNDEDAFRFLVEKHQKLVINTCNSFVHNMEDAQDIAQEVFIEVHRSIYKFRKEAKLSSWLYRISANRSLNFIRDNKKNKWLQSLDVLFGADSEITKSYIEPEEEKKMLPDQLMENAERAERIHKAIDSLAKNQKIAFTLHKYEDLSYKEIAEIMNLTVASVESLLFRSKKNLQKKLISIYKS